MKRTVYIILTFAFLGSLHAKPLEGPSGLIYFPEKQHFIKSSIVYNDLKVSTNKEGNFGSKIVETKRILEVEGGRKFGLNLLSVKLKYGNSSESSIKNSSNTNDSYTAVGFYAPTFSFTKRTKDFVKDGDYVYAYGIDFTPKIGKRIVGGTGSNNAQAGHELNFRLNKITKYDDWQFMLGAYYKYFAEGGQKDKSQDATIDSDAYAEYAVGLAFQNDLGCNVHIYGGFGFLIIEDIKTKNSLDSSISEIQQGTGSIGRVGVKYLQDNDMYQFEIKRRKNDYFIRNAGTNIEGDYTDVNFELSYLKEF